MAKTLSKRELIGNLDGFPIYLTRKTVKNVNYRLKKEGLFVSADPQVPLEKIYAYIEDNKFKFLQWIAESGWTESIPMFVQVKDVDINTVRLFGENYQVVFDHKVREMQIYKHFFLIPEFYKQCGFDKFLRDLDSLIEAKLREYIQFRLAYWASKTRINYCSFQIRKMTSRWGSCSVKTGRMRFNFYLAALPKKAIDTVVLHELVHMRVANHQKEFYDYILLYNPDYYRDYEIVRKTIVPVPYLDAKLKSR